MDKKCSQYVFPHFNVKRQILSTKIRIAGSKDSSFPKHTDTPIKTQNAARSYFQRKYIEHYVKHEPCKAEFIRKGEELEFPPSTFFPKNF